MTENVKKKKKKPHFIEQMNLSGNDKWRKENRGIR
jgi:hypothetical protein